MARRRRTEIAASAFNRPYECEFCVEGTAVSARTRNKPRLDAWKAMVASAARARWSDDRAPMDGDLTVHISEFSEFATGDRDNMAKPVLDAMQGIVYKNDRQVKNLHIEWCNIDGRYIVRFMSPVVAAALSAGNEFLWIRVSFDAPRVDLTR